ncbi:hypothetical protein Tco_0710951 [Tanacetum coccineum]
MVRRPQVWKVRCATMGTVLEQPETQQALSLQNLNRGSGLSGLKRKRATGDDGAGPSKRCPVATMIPLRCDGMLHLSPPQDCLRPFEGMPVDHQMRSLIGHCSAASRARGATREQAEADVIEVLIMAQNLVEEKMALLVKIEQERADAAKYKASWAVGEAGGDEVTQTSVTSTTRATLTVLSTDAERRWLISHGGSGGGTAMKKKLADELPAARGGPLKESLEAHAIGLAKKERGRRVRAIL